MTDPAPLYEVVKRHITDGIVSGKFAPGSKLPSEKELVEAFAVSRMTVNRALRELVRDGVIFRMQGVGSFVCETNRATSLVEVRDIRETIAERGGVYSCRILKGKGTLTNADFVELFDCVPKPAISSLTLVHFEDGQPLQLERRFVRRDFAPNLLKQDFTKISLYSYLQTIAPISELEHVVEAVQPDAIEQESLALAPAQPVLRIRRRTWVGHNVVTVGFFSHPGNRYRVAVRMRPSDVGV